MDKGSYKPYVPLGIPTGERVMTNEQRLEAELERTKRVVTRLARENEHMRALLVRLVIDFELVDIPNEG